MFEIGWTEMLVIAVVMIVVVGPKDLPKMLRTFGKFTGRMRSMAGEFRKQFDDAMKDAELDDVRSSIDSVRKMNPAADIRKALNPMEKAAADVRAGIDAALKPKPPAPPASPVAHVAEPLKAGPAAVPGSPDSTLSEAPAAADSATLPVAAAAEADKLPAAAPGAGGLP